MRSQEDEFKNELKIDFHCSLIYIRTINNPQQIRIEEL